METSNKLQEQIQAFCHQHKLPVHYQHMASQYFLALAKELAEASEQHPTLLIGINGCQGSGKSTLAAFLTQILQDNYNKTVANLSIDDFYHTKNSRQQMAKEIHPLFATRGVPGTHDTVLLTNTLTKLSNNSNRINIPRFDKALDEREPENRWDSVLTPVDIILLEGWCVGVTPQKDNELLESVNILEETEDTEGLWRSTVNKIIKSNYSPIFQQLHKLILLQAPTFDSVFRWRRLQEDKLHKTAGNKPALMDTDELIRFIHHYQRLTEHMLEELPTQASIIFELNEDHQIIGRRDNV